MELFFVLYACNSTIFMLKYCFHNTYHWLYFIINENYRIVKHKTHCEPIMFNSTYTHCILCYIWGLVIAGMLLFTFGVVAFAHSVTKVSLALRLMQSCRRPRMINSVQDFDEHCSAISSPVWCWTLSLVGK